MNCKSDTIPSKARDGRSPSAIRLGLLGVALVTFVLLFSVANASEENDADILIEGDLSETARFYLTDDYRLYFEGTGPVVCDTNKWIDYYHLITELHVSDGITDVENTGLQYYYSLERIYLGRDLEKFHTTASIQSLIFERGCGNIKSFSCWFEPGLLMINDDATTAFRDSFVEIKLETVPSSEIPKRDLDYVGFGKVYRLTIGNLDTFEGTCKIRLIIGDPEANLTVSHLEPIYSVDCTVFYTTDFYCNQTGYYVVKNEVPPLIPYAKELAVVLAAIITITAFVYYINVTRRVEEDG